jgi:hypothetical protein
MRIQSVSLPAAGMMIASLLLLGACASTDRIPKLVRTTNADFQKSFSDLTFKVLPAEQQVSLVIDRDGPGFSFEGGPSHYEALVLPGLVQPYFLQIDSVVVKTRLGYTGTLFFPVLTFLDANKQWIKTFDSLPYVTQTPFGKTNYMTVSLQISDELADARYVIIHTQDNKLDKAIGYYDGQDLMKSNSFSTMMIAPVDKPRWRYEFTTHGQIRLTAYSTPRIDKTPPVEY